MRYLLPFLLVLMSCLPSRRFVKAELPGRPCEEGCLVGELECVGRIQDNESYVWLGIFLLGGGSSRSELRICALYGDICKSQCSPAAVPSASPS